MDASSVVAQLRALAADPKNRAMLVKDQGSMQGLVYFLDNKDAKVIMTALEALYDLSENTSNRPVMTNLPYVMDGLQDVIQRQKSRKILNLAREILHRISPASHSPLRDHANQTRRQASTCKNGRHSKSFFVGNANKKIKLITLQIRGLVDQQSRKICEEHILKVKGVISFTFDLSKHRCTLRAKNDLKPESLIAAIAKSKTMSAEQVLKNECGEEVLLSFGANPTTVDKENNALPQYLPEDDSPIKGVDKAVVRTGKQEQQGSWLGSAAKFLSQSFYW